MDPIDEPALKRHLPGELRVFADLPKDEKVTTVDEFFVPQFTAPAEVKTQKEWAALRDGWMKALREDCFRAWPERGPDLPAGTPVRGLQIRATLTAEGLRLAEGELTSDDAFALKLWILHREDVKPEDLELVVLNVLDDESWKEFSNLAAVAFPAQFPGTTADAAAFAEERKMLLGTKWAMAYVCPRGIGAQNWAQFSPVKQTQLRRRFLLLGESVESGQVWDIQQAAAGLRGMPGFARVPLWLQSQKVMAANTLYASLFIPDVKRLDLHALPASQRDGPTYLNVLRHLDLPQAAALAAERATLAIYADDEQPWSFARQVATAMKWGEKRVQIRKPLDASAPVEPGSAK